MMSIGMRMEMSISSWDEYGVSKPGDEFSIDTSNAAYGLYDHLLTYLSAFRPWGVPGPTRKLSLCVPAQMGRRETGHKGGEQ
jgi:hypothetical protein